MLARLHRAGELTAVHVPDERDEAMRDLCRARTDVVQDLRDCRHQLKAFLLRHGYRYQERTSWSQAHMRYLRELRLAHPAMRAVLEEYLQAIDAATERIQRIETHMHTLLEEWHMRPVVKALMALKGFQTVAAMIVVSELGDIHRFPHPRQLMAYLGLVPSESSSGGSRAQGSITKCGNGHLRWIMVESAQHYRLPPRVGVELTKRQEEVGKEHKREINELSWRCQNRLHEKGRKLAARGKTRQKVQTALARELTAFVWEVMKVSTPLSPGTKPFQRKERSCTAIKVPPVKTQDAKSLGKLTITKVTKKMKEEVKP
jgi:transposase